MFSLAFSTFAARDRWMNGWMRIKRTNELEKQEEEIRYGKMGSES
jgi:hypothetical protein